MGKPFLFVGLDHGNTYTAAELAKELSEVDRDNFGFKLNLDFYLRCALSGDTKPLATIYELERPIFADLKMWHDPRTMSSIADGFNLWGKTDYINVYALAEKDFIKEVVQVSERKNTKVLGLTVLTYYDDAYCQKNRGGSLRETVRKDALTAYDAGCHGVILPGTLLDEVADLRIEKLVPAVRPDWYNGTEESYQKQEVSVKYAVKEGADILVCSTPIRTSDEPQDALIKILDEMEI